MNATSNAIACLVLSLVLILVIFNSIKQGEAIQELEHRIELLEVEEGTS